MHGIFHFAAQLKCKWLVQGWQAFAVCLPKEAADSLQPTGPRTETNLGGKKDHKKPCLF